MVRLVSSTGATRTQDVAAPSQQTTVGGLDNMAEQSVQVQAWNELGAGPFGPAVTMQSAGTPPALPAPRIAASGPGPAASSATLTLSWDQGSPNGPPTTRYSLYQSVDGGGWTKVTDTAPDVRTANVVIPYDGRTYRYTVTLTNGAGSEGPQANASSFTSVGQPSTPTVNATTPDADGRIRLTVGVGQPRAGSFSAVRWQGGGKSGTFTCGCAPGSQVVFKTDAFDTSPTNDRTITVWTVNSGGNESERRSDTATPYRDTLQPTGLSSTRSGNQITWSWNLPTNGRPITQVQVRGAVDQTFGSARQQVSFTGQDGQTYRLEVRAYSAAGWSTWAGPDSQSIPNPPASLGNVRKGGLDSASCGNCRIVDFTAYNVPAGSYTLLCYYDGRTTPWHTTSIYINGAGNPSGGYCSIDPNLANRIKLDLNPTSATSGWVNW